MKIYLVRILGKDGALGPHTLYDNLSIALDAIQATINTGAFSGVYLYEATPEQKFAYVNPKLGPE